MRLKITYFLLVTLFPFLSGENLMGQSQVPTLLSHGSIAYPPIARAARVEGDVRVALKIDAEGRPADVEYRSGPKMLSAVAIKAVKGWRFERSVGASSLETVFHFKLNPPEDGYNESGGPKTSVEIHSAREVSIIGIAMTELDRDKCPSSSEKPPPLVTGSTDYVELLRVGCMGTCPDYRVRVFRDGRVLWDGNMFVSAKGHAESKISPSDASELLARFQTDRFWRLCGNYSRAVTDSSSSGISVEFGGQIKTISVYAHSAPGWYHDLEMEIDRAVNTHRWRHGNPDVEPFTNISQDSYYPKPGITPLMIAAAKADETEVRRLLAAGADLKATDASGWTPLMYAAGSYGSPGTTVLLKAGADPSYQSPNGDTALMASALSGGLDENLVRAGANINLQNHDGVTALMLLADRGRPDPIKAALEAGADPLLRDSKGRSALDYLKSAHCGKSVVPRETGYTVAYTKCTALDSGDYLQSESLLTRLVHK